MFPPEVELSKPLTNKQPFIHHQPYTQSRLQVAPSTGNHRHFFIGSIREDNGPDQSVPDRVAALSDAECKEDALSRHLLRARSHRVPAHLVEHYAHFVHLVPLYVDRSVEHNVQ